MATWESQKGSRAQTMNSARTSSLPFNPACKKNGLQQLSCLWPGDNALSSWGTSGSKTTCLTILWNSPRMFSLFISVFTMSCEDGNKQLGGATHLSKKTRTPIPLVMAPGSKSWLQFLGHCFSLWTKLLPKIKLICRCFELGRDLVTWAMSSQDSPLILIRNQHKDSNSSSSAHALSAQRWETLLFCSTYMQIVGKQLKRYQVTNWASWLHHRINSLKEQQRVKIADGNFHSRVI